MRTSAAILILLVAAPAASQTIAAPAHRQASAGSSPRRHPCGDAPCTRRPPRRPGTHFIAEIGGGASAYDDGGLALEGIFGVGGKLRGFPPRFYLIGELAYGSNTRSGSSPLAGVGFRDERTYRDVAGGVRIYLPIYGPIRLLADAVIGSSHVSATLDRQGMPPLHVEGWLPLFALATGLQVRLFHHLSVGMRAKMTLTDEDLGDLRAAVGQSSPTRLTTTAGVTWHF